MTRGCLQKIDVVPRRVVYTKLVLFKAKLVSKILPQSLCNARIDKLFVPCVRLLVKICILRKIA